MNNVNDTYFDGYYKDMWKAIIPAQLTEKEVDFMIPYFHLRPGSHVLDLMCGYGRHAIALARKGIKVTAVDNLPEYVNEIKEIAGKENLSINAVQAGVLDFTSKENFDLVICMGNSINFFDAADTQKIFRNISTFLKSGGHLLINTWSIAEIAIKNFKETATSQVDGKNFTVESKFLFHPARIEAEHTITTADGEKEVKKGIDYIFSINELEWMLKEAGLLLKEVYSIPGRKEFTIGEPRAYLVAEKL